MRSALRFAVASLLASGLPHASRAGNWKLGATQEQDNYDDFRSKASARYSFGCSMSVYCFLDASVSHYGSAALGGIPGGSLLTGGLEAKLQTVAGPFVLNGAAGWSELVHMGSWTAEAQAKANLPWFAGTSARLEAGSRWLEGSWIGYSVRSNQATAALALERWSTFAEAGLVVDFRNGGRDPGASLPLPTPGNRLTTAYAWASRSWTPWLMAGLSLRSSSATADVHQATGMVGDSAVWSDFPYAAPTEESAVEFLLTVKFWKFTLSGDCPFASATKRRSDEQYPGGEAYYYWTSLTAPANASLKFEAPVSRWLVEAVLRASSRPYAPHSWFTGNAWNQVGFDITLRR
jgi:hypothetical protein